LAGVAVTMIATLPVLAAAADEPVVPLIHAHAHNDYEHRRPLFDALDCGFCSVEADVFLTDGRLLVGHTRKDLKPERTLERLYLDPLRQRVQANHGRVYKDGPTIFLLIDVKTEGRATYAALAKVLPQYADILSVTRHGQFDAKAVTVVISGNRDRDAIAGQDVRYAGIDGRLSDLNSTARVDLVPWISDNWILNFGWRGNGPMPEKDRMKLHDAVRKAHAHGRLVRFWATPEKVEVWKELRAAGVDLINTDQLPELQRFLLAEKRTERSPAVPR
jgi:hypothetical protein